MIRSAVTALAALALPCFATAQAVDLGFGLAGTGGVAPSHSVNGTLVAGSPLEFVVSGAAPNAQGTLVIGSTTVFLPIFGGILVPSADISVPITTDASGNASVQVTAWAANTTLYSQFGIVDAAAPMDLALSNAMDVTTFGTSCHTAPHEDDGAQDSTIKARTPLRHNRGMERLLVTISIKNAQADGKVRVKVFTTNDSSGMRVVNVNVTPGNDASFDLLPGERAFIIDENDGTAGDGSGGNDVKAQVTMTVTGP